MIKSFDQFNLISENLKYHIDNNISIFESVFRAGSEAHIEIISELRNLYESKKIEIENDDVCLFEQTDIGKYGEFNEKIVPLDFPFDYEINPSHIFESEYNGKDVDLNKPKRGGSKKYYVYTKNPKTGKVIKVSFGDTSGLKAKISNPVARKSFAARHDCKNKNDRTKPSYWSCRLTRYGKLLGFGKNYPGFW
jgi:hypothetical protein